MVRHHNTAWAEADVPVQEHDFFQRESAISQGIEPPKTKTEPSDHNYPKHQIMEPAPRIVIQFPLHGCTKMSTASAMVYLMYRISSPPFNARKDA